MVTHVLKRNLFYFILGAKSVEQGEEPEHQPQLGTALEETDSAMRLVLATKQLSTFVDNCFYSFETFNFRFNLKI